MARLMPDDNRPEWQWRGAPALAVLLGIAATLFVLWKVLA